MSGAWRPTALKCSQWDVEIFAVTPAPSPGSPVRSANPASSGSADWNQVFNFDHDDSLPKAPTGVQGEEYQLSLSIWENPDKDQHLPQSHYSGIVADDSIPIHFCYHLIYRRADGTFVGRLVEDE